MPAQVFPDLEFQRFLAEGRFMVQRSRSSGRFVFPPRVAEPGTGARDLEWVEVSGSGILYSITFIVKKDPAQNYNVALVDLAEGPRFLARLDQVTPQTAAIGMPVSARIIQGATDPVLVFVPMQRAEDTQRKEGQA